MTIKELYASIDGDYELATRVLCMDKLIDKYIRKFPQNGVVDNLIDAGKTMDPTQLFETAHAVKGVCANLGLVGLAGLASDIAEEYRPNNTRKLTDAEVKAKLDEVAALYQRTLDGIRRYEQV